MAEDFKAIIVGIFALVQAKATTRSGGEPSSSLATEIPSESPTLGGSEGNTKTGVEADTGDVREATTSSDLTNDAALSTDTSLEAQNIAPVDVAEKDVVLGPEEEGSGSGTGGGGEVYRASPWLVNAQMFVSKVLDWVKERVAERSNGGGRGCGRGVGPKPPKRSMPQC